MVGQSLDRGRVANAMHQPVGGNATPANWPSAFIQDLSDSATLLNPDGMKTRDPPPDQYGRVRHDLV
jgi:hypothetical protein